MRWLAASLVVVATGCADESAPSQSTDDRIAPASTQESVRVATFNVSLYRGRSGQLLEDLRADDDPQLTAVRDIIRRVDPDILVLNEFDYDAQGRALDLFADQLDAGYRYRLALPSNTGVASGVDFDNDGKADHPVGSRPYGGDSFGYGIHPGQYAFAVLSRYPIKEGSLRTFQTFLWRDLPNNLLPSGFYTEEAQQVFRLSSKNHADVPIAVLGADIHLLLAHPTPPGFDGPEDRNGRRNYDEIRFLTEYISGVETDWIVDDDGASGGLDAGAHFVIAGDLNADPADGDKLAERPVHAIETLVSHPLVTDPQPRSAGGADAAAGQGGTNAQQTGDPSLDTADFNDKFAGNLRVDYVLPSTTLTVVGSGVFWPAKGEPGFALVGEGYPAVSSDHRLVWVDLELPE
ncbi:MAG: endonuclease/exonuclease/phosphatase family protein [Pseudomonadota bacterium]